VLHCYTRGNVFVEGTLRDICFTYRTLQRTETLITSTTDTQTDRKDTKDIIHAYKWRQVPMCPDKVYYTTRDALQYKLQQFLTCDVFWTFFIIHMIHGKTSQNCTCRGQMNSPACRGSKLQFGVLCWVSCIYYKRNNLH
jgi:hypothetical protein